MKHYVMTTARRGPEQPISVNRRRIELARAVTARSLAAQPPGWTWLVYVHPDDPLLGERLDAFRSAGAPVVAIEDSADAERVIDWSGRVLTTRIDDDDAFAGDAFERLYRAAAAASETTALMFPEGHMLRDGLVTRQTHLRNAWVSIIALDARAHVRQVQHQRIPRHFPVSFVDRRPAWLRVRHDANDQPTGRHGHWPIDDRVRSLYPVDWRYLEGLAMRAAA